MENNRTNSKEPEKRIEYREKHVRISRTGGISASKTFSGDGYGVTINTNHGIRLHKRLFKGVRMGFQNGNFQFIGKYSDGPFNFNVSKNGVSTSLKHKRGTYNLFKPNYSSFNLGGIQVRGKNAAIYNIIYLLLIIVFNTLKLCLIVKKPTAQTAHLVFANTQAKVQKTKRAVFCQRLTE